MRGEMGGVNVGDAANAYMGSFECGMRKGRDVGK